MPFRELDIDPTTGDLSTIPSGAADKIAPLPVKRKLASALTCRLSGS